MHSLMHSLVDQIRRSILFALFLCSTYCIIAIVLHTTYIGRINKDMAKHPIQVLKSVAELVVILHPTVALSNTRQRGIFPNDVLLFEIGDPISRHPFWLHGHAIFGRRILVSGHRRYAIYEVHTLRCLPTTSFVSHRTTQIVQL